MNMTKEQIYLIIRYALVFVGSYLISIGGITGELWELILEGAMAVTGLLLSVIQYSNEAMLSTVRKVLLVIGAILIAKGIIDTTLWATIFGALIGIATVIWGMTAKRKDVLKKG